MKTIKTYALARDASGAPDIIERAITLNHVAYDHGDHYDEIEQTVSDEDYEFIGAFDENDPAAAAFRKASGLAGALQACVLQIEQMKGMFDDSDGTIQDALDAAEESLNGFYGIREAPAP